MARASKAVGATTAKKAAAKKTTVKRSAAKKSVAKKAAAKRTVAKKSTVKKSTPKKSTVKKAPAKTTVKKTAVSKTTTSAARGRKDHVTEKKAAAKKAASKKSAPKKAAAKKAAAKKSTTATKAAASKTAASTAAPKKTGRPRKVRSPFDSRFLERMRKSLIAEREVYERQARLLRAEAESLVADLDPGDVQFDEESGEGDTIAVERNRDLALAAKATEMIEEIDHALTKFDAGTYGICEVSGDPIPEERLDAIPWARERVEYKVGGFGRR